MTLISDIYGTIVVASLNRIAEKGEYSLESMLEEFTENLSISFLVGLTLTTRHPEYVQFLLTQESEDRMNKARIIADMIVQLHPIKAVAEEIPGL